MSIAKLLFGSFVTLIALVSTSVADDIHPGKAVYLRYCSACHGPGAKGDGIVASLLTPKPNDLTLIAKNNNGEFKPADVAKSIDGRTTTRAHGDPDMPVWGEVFDEEGAEAGAPPAQARKKVRLITEYLQSIQAK